MFLSDQGSMSLLVRKLTYNIFLLWKNWWTQELLLSDVPNKSEGFGWRVLRASAANLYWKKIFWIERNKEAVKNPDLLYQHPVDGVIKLVSQVSHNQSMLLFGVIVRLDLDNRMNIYLKQSAPTAWCVLCYLQLLDKKPGTFNRDSSRPAWFRELSMWLSSFVCFGLNPPLKHLWCLNIWMFSGQVTQKQMGKTVILVITCLRNENMCGVCGVWRAALQHHKHLSNALYQQTFHVGFFSFIFHFLTKSHVFTCRTLCPGSPGAPRKKLLKWATLSLQRNTDEAHLCFVCSILWRLLWNQNIIKAFWGEKIFPYDTFGCARSAVADITRLYF